LILWAEYRAALRVLRSQQIDLVYAHWVMPQGIVAQREWERPLRAHQIEKPKQTRRAAAHAWRPFLGEKVDAGATDHCLAIRYFDCH